METHRNGVRKFKRQDISPSMLAATQATIRKMAWYTAQGTNQRAKDAQKHCRKLGIDWTKPLTN